MHPAKTISTDGIYRMLGTALLCLELAGCGVAAAPPCPAELDQTTQAPSAGCMALQQGKLLVVQNRTGRLSPPGGSAESGESAQCTAFRETWEETGLHLQPSELLAVFDTGFHLYHCRHHPESGELDPPQRFEVSDAFYLAPADFNDWEWRFPGQEETLRTLAEKAATSSP